jgi:hypothetical protein
MATELIFEVIFISRSLDVNLDEPSLISEDNMSVFLNTSGPSSVLKKKHSY